MYRYELEVLEQYGIQTDNLIRGRGSWICDTGEGLKILQEYTGSVQKLIWQKLIQERAEDGGVAITDLLLPNLEGELYSRDRAGTVYILRNWYRARECDTHARQDIRKGTEILARLHNEVKIPYQMQYAPPLLYDECCRHNRELRRAATYLRKKKGKNEFEETLYASIDGMIRQGEEAVARMAEHGSYRVKESGDASVCHGDYTQHNVLFAGSQTVITGFGCWNFDRTTADLYQFMRKILEKNDWNRNLGVHMVRWYSAIRPLDDMDITDLMLRLSYPWKSWKLVNYYMQSSKSIPPRKYMEKIHKIMKQQDNWQCFINFLFSDLFFQ